MRVLALTTAVGLVIGTASVQAASLITNGSFETPVVPTSGFTNFASGSSAITGWTVTGPEVSVVSGSFAQNGVSFHAQDLNQWLDLTGFNANSAEGVSQSVPTTAGNQYQLSYYIGNTTGGGIFGTSSTVNVKLNGVQTFSDANSAVNTTGLTWQQVTHTFVANAASTTLNFVNGDPVSDNSNGLDNVTLIDLGPSAPVPEPDTYAMMVAGLGLVGCAVRRRRRIGARCIDCRSMQRGATMLRIVRDALQSCRRASSATGIGCENRETPRSRLATPGATSTRCRMGAATPP